MSDSEWPPPEGVTFVSTLKCKSCGAQWIITDNPEEPEHITKTDTYRCAHCGEAAVFELGLKWIRKRQG